MASRGDRALRFGGWNSCLAILTEDLGVRTDSGYELNGRAKGAEARGCSIAVDEVMAANA